MRLKSYTAPSMAEAMRLVRHELGEEAIIVSTQRAAGGKGVRITAALEIEEPDPFEQPPAPEDALAGAMREALEEHGTPRGLAEKLLEAAAKAGGGDVVDALTYALDERFIFAPLPDHGAPRPFMLVGPPGAGKTLAVAKLAARSVLRGRSVGVITADNHRAGAVAQLAAFTRILEIELSTARGPESLREAVEAATAANDIVFIDSPGLNPFKPHDMDYLAALAETADVEPILVMAAGGDATEAAEIGEAFSEVGATRLLATRLDMTRRFGAIMAAADAAQLMFCEVSATPHVANGLSTLSAAAVARLLLPPESAFAAGQQQETEETETTP